MIVIDNIQGTGQRLELNKIVIKLGSAVIAGQGAAVDEKTLCSLSDSIARLREGGVQVIVVSSGAQGIGRRAFPDFKPKTMPDKQALAAIGQVGLMHTWKTLFNARGFRAAQLLLTRDDMSDRRRYLNTRYTLDKLHELGAVPVINENDTTTIEELKFGDNDQLSALVATRMNADLLVILSVVDGLYPGDPAEARKKGKKVERIPVVERWDEALLGLADTTRSSLGTGGMTTKLLAMRMACRGGVHGVIAGGKAPGILDEIVGGTFRGTYFMPRCTRPLSVRERWIAFGRSAAGRQLLIDAGAQVALVKGKKSLLAAGVREVRGEFSRGDVVEVLGPEGQRLAKGLVNYDSDELSRIMGKRTSQIREILGDVHYEEVIHRDNMIMVE